MRISALFGNLIVAGSLLALPALAQPMPGDDPPDAPPPPEMVVGMGGGPGGPGMPGCPVDCPPGVFGMLGLSDDQLDRLANLKSQLEVNTAAKKAQLKAKMLQMCEVMTAPDVDKGKAQSLHNEISSLRDDLAGSRFNFFLDASAVLTPDQRKELRHHMLSHMLTGGICPKMHHHFMCREHGHMPGGH